MNKELLEQFFKEIAELTINHDILSGNAVVFVNKLGNALEKVNPDWWKFSLEGIDNSVECHQGKKLNNL